jgi:peptidoglycan/LPS O-acetylase OafA/YrhL
LGNLGLLHQIPFPDATVSVVSIANNAVPLLMFGFAAVTSVLLMLVDADVRGVPPWALRTIGLVGLILNGLCVAMVAVGATGNIDSPLIAYGWFALALTPGVDFVIVGLAALAAVHQLSASSHHDSALLASSQNEL